VPAAAIQSLPVHSAEGITSRGLPDGRHEQHNPQEQDRQPEQHGEHGEHSEHGLRHHQAMIAPTLAGAAGSHWR
jgi:hypothetical protein